MIWAKTSAVATVLAVLGLAACTSKQPVPPPPVPQTSSPSAVYTGRAQTITLLKSGSGDAVVEATLHEYWYLEWDYSCARSRGGSFRLGVAPRPASGGIALPSSWLVSQSTASGRGVTPVSRTTGTVNLVVEATWFCHWSVSVRY